MFMESKVILNQEEMDKITSQLTYSRELLERAASEIEQLSTRITSLEAERDTLQEKYDKAMALIGTFEEQIRGIEALAHEAIRRGEELERERDELKEALSRTNFIN
jgi:chromosome segregation ATPase